MIESGSARLLRLIQEPITAEVPKGWKTAEEYMRETGLGRTAVLKLLRQGIKDGTVKARRFSIPCASRASYPIIHYFIHREKI